MKDRFFVSSTYIDLKSERLIAKMAIGEANGEAVLFEFNIEAQDDNSLNVCLSEVRQSDCVIVLLGHNYGFDYQGKSISEREYETAKESGIPRLVFKLKGQTLDDKQKAFIEKVGNIEDGSFYNEFADVEDLSKKIKSSIAKWRTNREEKAKEVDRGFLSIVPLNIYSTAIFVTPFTLAEPRRAKAIYGFLFDNDRDYYTINSDFIFYKDQIWSLRDPKKIFKSHPELWTLEVSETIDLKLTLATESQPVVTLLNKSVRSWLLQNNWQYYHKDRIYYPLKGEEETIKRKWKKQYKTSEKSIVTTMKSKEGRLICTRYLAFRANVEIYSSEIFLSVTPTYFFTNMYGFKSKYGSSYLSGIKRLETNDAVSTNVAFMIDTIRESFNQFSENNTIDYLELGQTIQIQLPK